MRKMWALAFAPVLTFAFFMVGSAPANAFGGEVLGCYSDAAGVTGGWTASHCSVGGKYFTVGDLDDVKFEARNLSGAYTFAWTVGLQGATTFTPFTGSCASDTAYNCISSGCTATSATCVVTVKVGATGKSILATLKLTQSGLSRTISATAGVEAAPTCCK